MAKWEREGLRAFHEVACKAGHKSSWFHLQNILEIHCLLLILLLPLSTNHLNFHLDHNNGLLTSLPVPTLNAVQTIFHPSNQWFNKTNINQIMSFFCLKLFRGCSLYLQENPNSSQWLQFLYHFMFIMTQAHQFLFLHKGQTSLSHSFHPYNFLHHQNGIYFTTLYWLNPVFRLQLKCYFLS